MAPGRVKSDALLLVLLALVLGAFGQLAFGQEPRLGQPSGLVLFALASISLLAAMALVPPSDQTDFNPVVTAVASSNPVANRRRIWALLVLVLGSGAVLYTAVESLRRAQPVPRSDLLPGLSVYVYAGGRLMPVILAGFLFTRWVQGGRLWRDHGWHPAALIAAATLAAAPLLDYCMAHPAEMTARRREVNILQNGWLENEALLTGRSRTALLLEQFFKSTLALHLYTDRTSNYAPGVPLPQFAPGIMFVFGLVTCLRQPRRAMNLLLPIWFLSVAITRGMLLENLPNSGRLVLAILAVLLLTALGLERVLDVLAAAASQSRQRQYLDPAVMPLFYSYEVLVP